MSAIKGSVIETNRLLLTPWEDTEEYWEGMYSFAKDPDVGPHAGWKPHETIEESKETVGRYLSKDMADWMIREKESRRILGYIGIYEDGARRHVKSVEIGYALGSEFWGKGIMTEACRAVIDRCFGDEEMNLSVISIRTSAVNLRSQRVIEKCGFTYEGTLRKATRTFEGKDMDRRFYSITREEWEGHTK